MDHINYERELKYLFSGEQTIDPEDVFAFLKFYGFRIIDRQVKRKNEIYYDNDDFSFIKRGDVIRRSSHIKGSDVYTHFMYKKNVYNPNLPYVSKYEYGSGLYDTVDCFVSQIGLSTESCLSPVLYATMVRNIAIFEKNGLRLYTTYDTVDYYKDASSIKVRENMLEVEDWTTPNTIENANNRNDSHLLEVNDLLLRNSRFPLYLTKDSKPFRGYYLLKKNNIL